MQDVAAIDWDNSSAAGIAMMVCQGPSDKVRGLARNFDWDRHPTQVLGSLVARKDIDLGTMLTVFFAAGPLKYNYIGKRDVPKAYREMCAVLDNICQRVNCGYYLPLSGSKVEREDKLRAWIGYQQDDASQGRAGRWVLNETIVNKMLCVAEPRVIVAPQEAAVSGFYLLKNFLKPLKKLGETIPFLQRLG